MAKLKAVVLAAGRGVRMGGEHPKTLLPLLDGRSMFELILDGLAVEGIDDLIVVTGFKPAEVEAAVAGRWSGEVQYVRNARFASWGNFHSVRVALDQAPGRDLLVVNSDVVIAPRVYGAVASAPGDLVIAVQKRLTFDEEDMKVRLERDRVLGIGKGLSRAHGHGEFVGVSLIRASTARLYGDICNALEWRARTNAYYEDVYSLMTGRCEVRAAFVEPGEYAEVDVPADVPAAETVARGLSEARADVPA